MTEQASTQKDETIAAIKSVALFPIIMAIFILVDVVWFGLAWDLVGLAVFVLIAVYAGWLIFRGVKAICVSALTATEASGG